MDTKINPYHKCSVCNQYYRCTGFKDSFCKYGYHSVFTDAFLCYQCPRRISCDYL